jgi:hypothetical protein
MKKTTVLHILLVLVTVLALTSIAADGGRFKLETTLTGAAEVPGPGDPDGSGTAKIWLSPNHSEVCWKLKVEGIAPATAAHIHVGSTTVAGPVVVALSPPTSGTSKGCASVDPALISAIIENPEQYYVNVHNADFPAGALRGQLSD